MNASSNQSHPQDNTSQESKPPAATNLPGAAGSKLKEAQAKLIEAEAKLMESNGLLVANAATTSPSTTDEARPQPEVAPHPSAKQDANAKKEGVTERLESTAKRVSMGDHAPVMPVTERLSENVAGMLCYLFGWVGGLVFLFIDRRPFVRFHAAQSVAIFATLNILILALGGFLLGALLPSIGGALLIFRHLLELAWLVTAVVLMLKVAGGERFRVKVASQYADRAAHDVK
jgi:uncharacterized membrane protein